MLSVLGSSSTLGLRAFFSFFFTFLVLDLPLLPLGFRPKFRRAFLNNLVAFFICRFILEATRLAFAALMLV